VRVLFARHVWPEKEQRGFLRKEFAERTNVRGNRDATHFPFAGGGERSPHGLVVFKDYGVNIDGSSRQELRDGSRGAACSGRETLIRQQSDRYIAYVDLQILALAYQKQRDEVSTPGTERW
jgi:hypothetical protein